MPLLHLTDASSGSSYLSALQPQAHAWPRLVLDLNETRQWRQPTLAVQCSNDNMPSMDMNRSTVNVHVLVQQHESVQDTLRATMMTPMQRRADLGKWSNQEDRSIQSMAESILRRDEEWSNKAMEALQRSQSREQEQLAESEIPSTKARTTILPPKRSKSRIGVSHTRPNKSKPFLLIGKNKLVQRPILVEESKEETVHAQVASTSSELFEPSSSLLPCEVTELDDDEIPPVPVTPRSVPDAHTWLNQVTEQAKLSKSEFLSSDFESLCLKETPPLTPARPRLLPPVNSKGKGKSAECLVKSLVSLPWRKPTLTMRPMSQNSVLSSGASTPVTITRPVTAAAATHVQQEQKIRKSSITRAQLSEAKHIAQRRGLLPPALGTRPPLAYLQFSKRRPSHIMVNDTFCTVWNA